MLDSVPAISAAPRTARAGLTVPDPRLRAAALEELARHVAETLASEETVRGEQLGLPL